jgi:hypothetical protein
VFGTNGELNMSKSDSELLKKFQKILVISQKVKKSEVAKYLQLTEEELFVKLVEWGNLGFKLNEDYIVVENIESFSTALDQQFANWAENESSKDGKLEIGVLSQQINQNALISTDLSKHCPQCRSSHAKEIPDKSKVISYIPRPIYGKKWKCTQCGYEWKKKSNSKIQVVENPKPISKSKSNRQNNSNPFNLCLQCGSSHAKEIPDKSKVISYIPRPIYGKKWQCNQCGYEWSKD